MQLEANADTSAEDESFGPQLVSRLEVGVQSALEPLPNTPAAPFPSDQVVSENRVAKFSLGFCPKKTEQSKTPTMLAVLFCGALPAVYLFLTCTGYLQHLLNQIMVSSAFLCLLYN